MKSIIRQPPLKVASGAMCTISIYSDSQAAIRSIAATTSKSTSVSKCRKSLHEMAEHFDICLIWVPGHQDISGNCIADESCGDEEEEESSEHFVCSCPALSSRRLRFMGSPFLDGLGDLPTLSLRKIAHFIQSSNWTPFQLNAGSHVSGKDLRSAGS
ncbi:hypothetical protein ACLKA6_007567 [Drosophila palustris]